MKKYLLKNKSRFALLISFWLFSYVSTCAQVEAGVIQLDIKNLLNARPVSTFQDGKITSWNIGIDGNGEADGYLTLSAANFMGDKDPKALPDNPLFPANFKHPEILLHYSNSNTTDPQALAMKGISQFTMLVPSNFYKDLYLAFTSAEGASKIRVEMQYNDTLITKDFLVPDYYVDLSENDPDFCYLAHDLAKWGKKNEMTEKDHHNIDLLNIHPDPKRKLLKIAVKKEEAAYLVFWAATGVIAKK